MPCAKNRNTVIGFTVFLLDFPSREHARKTQEQRAKKDRKRRKKRIYQFSPHHKWLHKSGIHY
jgi:hypothetical protein